jgi:voltage-gated potassium channel
LLIGVIVLNVVAVVLEAVPQLAQQYRIVFAAIEYLSVAIFTLEYAARIWVAPEDGMRIHGGPARSRMRYILSPAGLVDLIAVLPFWLAPFVSNDVRLLQTLRVFRFLKNCSLLASNVRKSRIALHGRR